MVARETIVILDFGSQYSQLIARRVREAAVYCELVPYHTPAEEVMHLQPRGFILSGGPASVYAPDAPHLPDYVLQSGRPVLGICYGMQLLAYHLGGRVDPAPQREYGLARIELTDVDNPLFADARALAGDTLAVWMSHGDRITQLPPGFEVLARSANSPIAAMGDLQRHRYGLQFHPEVVHTPQGMQIIRAFLYDICGCAGGWTPGNFIEEAVQSIRARVGAGQVLCALSGGVDSAVTATLVHRAVGGRLTCIFVNTGLLRQGEPEEVVATFRDHLGMRLIAVDASAQFLADLQGVTDPEVKRQRIGARFIRVFEAEAARLGGVDFLAQGTLYPDVIESTAPDRAVAAKIKTHHNVGGLPPDMRFQLIEPLRYLFKDEVRRVGEALGLPRQLVWRHPFPGPGLAVRILGEVTRERLETLRHADAIFIEELWASGWYERTAQAFAVLLPVQTVGVMGDARTYASVVALRAVTTEDFMTADWARLPEELLARVSNRIVNEVKGVNRVVYDISSKPPATVEWE
ncbi:MAG: glutamine-hydrolyzing GMP synthase [Anaerolineae bacterium]|nr:glutamine-hydrolyzing GMP synthase [Anaerolineae bacterium]MDW8072281.1 glutamine-hydrolyzing GMP synthase [Anaerolineae bacterium]